MAVRAAGGIAVVQDPADAWVGGMPHSAAKIDGAADVVPGAELAALLVQLIQQPISSEGGSDMVDPVDKMADLVINDMDQQIHNGRRGQLSTFSCPECGGTLWQVDETQIVRFRCHVGHIYQAENLLAEQADGLEAALWTAVRTFKERHLLSRQLAERERERGAVDAAARFEEMARQAEHYGALIQQYLLNGAPETWGASGSPPAGDESV
jgi:two-component system chemotaxis response regulator CheB